MQGKAGVKQFTSQIINTKYLHLKPIKLAKSSWIRKSKDLNTMISYSAIETSSTALSKIGCHSHYLQKCNNKATPTSQPTRNLAGPEAFGTCPHEVTHHHT